ncbi:hypothetical protein G6F35_012777 [Rhizopus arrhizus]|nr:hypothetical protein G6F35_012777 [Rhizopus arrhizus]
MPYRGFHHDQVPERFQSAAPDCRGAVHCRAGRRHRADARQRRPKQRGRAAQGGGVRHPVRGGLGQRTCRRARQPAARDRHAGRGPG